MTIAALALAFVAGVLSTLSPCVLPLLPIVLAAAGNEHRLGPAALAGGLVVSFVAIGLFVATIGFSIGLDTAVFRMIAATLLIGIGLVFLIPQASLAVSAAASPAGAWVHDRFSGFSTLGLQGQFLLGLLLGAVWSPCVGPTLGAASVLAAQGRDLGQVALTMALFGLGTAAPLLMLGMMSRETMLKFRSRLQGAGRGGKIALGAALVVAGLLTISGADKLVEAYVVGISPTWLTELTTKF